jgi:hypothetical protein
LHRGLCRSAKEKGASADGPAGPIAPVFEGVELNAIVEQMLERFARILGALIEKRAEVTNPRDDVLGPG